MWKRYANYQGGTADPMIVSWPAQIKKFGLRTQYQHAIDIVPTIYDCLGVEMPEVYRGATQIPLEGASFKATFDDEKAPGRTTQFYSMLSTRAIYHDGWKAASVTPATPDGWAEFATQRWELFDTEADPCECHDLADKHPDKLQELISLWWAQAGMYNALPLESRTAIAILDTERPQLAKPRDQYVYYPGCEEVPESVAVNIRNRSYAIVADVTLEKGAAGVLFAHGCRFGGHALYIKDGKLKYDYNYVGEYDQYVESSEPVPTGDCRLSASFEKSGTGTPTEGLLSLYFNDKKVGEGKIKTQPGKFSLAGEGLNVGMDRGEPVTDDYPGDAPWPFTGGTIHKVIVNVSGDPWVDREKEVRAAFARD
jgi:arylsulfatase